MSGTMSITCPKCQKVSHSLADVQNKYCGTCGWHSEFVRGELTASELLQIKMASQGCISGVLAEWPLLDKAFKKLGVSLPPDTHHIELRDKSISVLDQRNLKI